MISVASISDLESLAELGPKFWSEAGLPGKFIKEIFVRNWEKLIISDLGVIFFHSNKDGKPDGAIGVTLYRDINDDELVMHETFWFVSPDSRGSGIRLFKEAEKLAKTLGVKRMIMAHVLNAHADKLARFYPKMGFSPIEVNYLKQI